MPVKDGNSVALERRMDLASLFCMIGRHGPAVALAVIAMVSVLAAFIIYRSVRGKTRRKATATAGDRDGDRDGDSPGAQRDASGASCPEQEPSPGDPRSSSAEATDVSDEVSSEMKDDVDPFQRNLKLRHRRAPAAENKPSYSPPESNVQTGPDSEAGTEVQDAHGEAETYPEEAAHNLTKVESATDDGVREEEVLEEVRGNVSCRKDDGSETTDDIEDDSCCCICQGKDELEEENQDSIDEGINEGEEAEDEFVEQQLVPQRDKAQISGVVDSLESTSDCQQPQSEENKDEISKRLDEDTDLTDPGSDAPSLQKELHHKTNQTSADDTMAEESVDLHLPSQDEDQQTVRSFDREAVEDTSVTAAPDTSEETSPPDTLALPQDQETDQMLNNGTTQDLDPLMWKPPLPSPEQSELRDQDEDSMLSPGVEAESGISSMAVSPDLQDAGQDFGATVEDLVVPQSEEVTEPKNNLYADDAAVSVMKDDPAGLVFGPYPSRVSHQPHSEHTDEAKHEACAANEDTFGHEIEDSYHRAVEQLMVHISANVMITADELRTDRTDEKMVVEVVKIHEKKEDVRTVKKMETETEKEDIYEKTEISIMEATMDNNEWLTESYQVLPWMNFPVTSFSKDHKNTDQPRTDDHRPSSSLTDVSCVDTELAPSSEDRHTSSVSAVGEHTEHNKKVVAVHPMPQNVNVTFSIHYLTRSPYQKVAVTGNQQELGNWKDFVLLERAKDGHWATVVSLPAESHVEWKFVLVEKGEVCRWEECGNRLLDTGYADELSVHKWWGLLG